jgi:hypothetical protein
MSARQHLQGNWSVPLTVCKVHGPAADLSRRCPDCDRPLRTVKFVPASVAEKLATQLRYALDALEGKPWTGWTTNDAHAALAEYRAARPREERMRCDHEGNWDRENGIFICAECDEPVSPFDGPREDGTE